MGPNKYSKSNMLIPRITMRAHLKFGYRIANHTPSMNVERRWLKEKLKEVDFDHMQTWQEFCASAES